jgi:hypothetical protein
VSHELIFCWVLLITLSAMVGSTLGAIRGRATLGGWLGVVMGPAGWIIVLTMRAESDSPPPADPSPSPPAPDPS